MSEGRGGECQAGAWSMNGAPPLEFLFEWVIDPASPTPPVVGSSGWVTVGQHDFIPTGPLVNHELACRVTARDGSGTSAPVYANNITGGNAIIRPTVDFVLNGRTVSGDVGGGLSGTDTVVVTLRRDTASGTQRVVDTSPPATIAANGTFSALLPTHGVADNRDTVHLDFTGSGPVAGDPSSSGVPPDATLALNGGNPFVESWDRRDGLLSNFGPMLTGGGTGIDIFSPAGGGNATVTVHAPPALGGDQLLDTTDRNWGEPGDPFRTTFSGVATNNDPISIDGRGFFAPQDAVLPFRIGVTKDAGLLNSIDDSLLRGDETFPRPDPTLAPYCYALLYQYTGPGIICRNLDRSVGYDVTHKRGVATIETVAIAPGGNEAALTNVIPGDVLELRQAGIVSPRLLTSVTVRTLQVHLNWDGMSATCSPGYWVGLTYDTLCDDGSITLDPETFNETPRISAFENDFPAMVTLEDDLSGGGTAVMVPTIWTTVPATGQSMSGSSWTARASTSNDAFMFADGTPGTTVTLYVRPWVSPVDNSPWTQIAGNVDTEGVTVSGLAPDIYEMRWRMADSNGDTRDVMGWFVQQSASGTQGPAGPAGPAGPEGPQGPTGPAAADAKATCTTKRLRGGRVSVTCKVSFAQAGTSTVSGWLMRKTTTYASSRRNLTGGVTSTLRLTTKRAIRRGTRVNAVLVFAKGADATVLNVPLKLR